MSSDDDELVRRMQAWAAKEDELRRKPMAPEEVARVLPDLLRLAEVLPARPDELLRFPPIGDGPGDKEPEE
jgi:hypothetical protein